MLVRLFTSNYAPCSVQAMIVNRRERERVVRHVVGHGGPDEDTALLSWDDLEGMVPKRKIRELQDGWDVTVRMDDFTARTLYGYDANTL